MTNNNFKNVIQINKLDNNKKANMKNRTIISIAVFCYYVLIILFSFLADNTGINTWLNINFSKAIKIAFSTLYLIMIYIPLLISMFEVNRLVFEKNKTTLIWLIVVSSIFYFLPNILYINFVYFDLFKYNVPTDIPNLYSNEVLSTYNKLIELNKIRLYFGSIFGGMLLTIIVCNVCLSVYKKNNIKNVLTLNFLMFIVPFGFMSFGVIGLLKSWVVLIFVFLSVVLTDASCYLVGIFFGKHKMSPITSPNKTWEGAIGGSVVALLILIVYASLWRINMPDITTAEGGFLMLSIFRSIKPNGDWVNWLWIILTGLVLVIISILGDLMFSYIKRQYNIKDYGNSLKSHGGILDRFDSMIFVSTTYTIILFITSSMVDWPLFGTSM